MITLYPDQLELYQKAVNSFAKGNRRVLIASPCGSGKSILFLYMCEQAIQKGNRVLVLVHRKELKEQHLQLFKDYNIPMDNIRVALFFSEANHLGENGTYNLIIADEAHWMPNSLIKVLNYYDCWTIALTATPQRLSGEPLGAVYQDLISGLQVKQLIEMNRLAPFDYYSVPVADTSALKVSHGDYVISDIETLLMESKIYGEVIDCYKKFCEGKKTIIYTASIKHSQEVAQKFKDAGYKAAHIDSNTPKSERAKIMNKFRSGEIMILVNVMLIVEGISVPSCEACILLRPTLSLPIYIQSASRCLRYKEGKRAVIVDMVANYAKLGLPDDNREWSLDKPLKKRNVLDAEGNFYIRTCPECFMVFKSANVCPFCGVEYPVHPRELKAKQEIELARITAIEAEKVETEKKQLRKQQGQARTFPELVAIGKQRGMKNPAYWAKCVLEGRKR